MVRLLRHFWALCPGERWSCLHALVAVARTDVELRTIGYLRSVRRAERLAPPTHAPTALEVRAARHMARRVGVASTIYPLHAECLHRAVTLHRLLRRAGLEGVLRIGVRKVEGELNAHAWVELAGEVVSDPPGSVESYRPLTSARVEMRGTAQTGQVASN